MKNNNLILLAEPLINFFIQQANIAFPSRVQAIFKIGSLGNHGGFSYASDVDIALILDHIKPGDEHIIKNLSDEIKTSDYKFANKLSLFWSSYDARDFAQGVGRFFPLDRLDLIEHGSLIFGEDKRINLPKPTVEEIILASAHFIADIMLTEDRLKELVFNPQHMLNKNPAYFSKYVLMPVRLLFTLDFPQTVASNQQTVDYFYQNLKSGFPAETSQIVELAFEARQYEPGETLELDVALLKKPLLLLYDYCLLHYIHRLKAIGDLALAAKLQNLQTIISRGTM